VYLTAQAKCAHIAAGFILLTSNVGFLKTDVKVIVFPSANQVTFVKKTDTPQ
jgi:hypothetical protein